jgi:hypothetical protein
VIEIGHSQSPGLRGKMLVFINEIGKIGVMNAQQWIAFGILVVLVVFLIVAYFVGKRLEPHQWQILRLLCALTAAFAGWFIPGAIFVEYVQQLSAGGKTLVQVSAGMGLFLLVWFSFKTISPKPDFAFTVPPGWNLQQAAVTLAKNDQSDVDLSALTANERNAPLQPATLRTGTALKALQRLGSLANAGAIRPYTVSYNSPTYTFHV